jgi:hypothetical protein
VNTAASIHLVATPLRAELASGLSPIDFADCYHGRLPRSGLTALQVAHAMFEQPPGWASALMGLRDRIVRLFGLKTAGAIQRGSAGSHVGIFPLISQSPGEVVMGLDDKHLDFRIWLAVRPVADGSEVLMSTLIRHNGISGRIYLFVVMPFHKLLSRYMLARAIRFLQI